MFKVELRKLKTHRIKDAVLAVICLLLVIPILIYGFPFLVGADGSYTVMSGSMSPALRPGDLVIVKGEEPINLGDMVTVESGEFTYTHRVVERLEGDMFRLKGDANEDPDANLVEASQIIGKVVLIFPFSHLYTPYGLVLAMLAPAALIIGKQVYTIHQSTKRRNRRETMRWRRKNHSALDTGTLLLALILTVSTTRIIAPHFIGGSSSYFSDTEWSTGFFQVGTWHVDALVDIDLDPDTLNLNSKGRWITCYIELPDGFHPSQIEVDTIMLLDKFYIDETGPTKIGDYDKDGILDLMVKFDRASVIAYLIKEGYKEGKEATLTVSGFVDGVRFSGTDTIVVIKGG
jgi:signal peptidase